MKGLIARLLSRAQAKPAKAKSNIRGLPTHACICGNKIFKILAVFDEGSPAFWFTDGECADCGTLLTVPTPVDGEPASA